MDRLTNNIIFLWLNDNHYDVVLSPKTFSQRNINNFCFKCMKYYSRLEFATTHVCKTDFSCLKCYSTMGCANEDDFRHQCELCKIIFCNRECYRKHLTNRIFTPKQSNYTKRTPCQYFFFRKTCYRTVTRYFFIKSGKALMHDCSKVFCYHCNK